MLCCLRLAAAALALATSSADPAVIEAGRPARVRIVARVAIVDGQTITAAVLDPIYVRDRVVVAAGATVTGRLETSRGASTRQQAAAMAGGDLTPPIGARVRFESLAIADEPPIRIVATGVIDTDAPAPTTGEWVKDYLLTQLPYHRRYVHRDAIATMTFVEPVAIARPPAVPQPVAATVPARLLTRVDSTSASIGDPVRAVLLAPVRGPDGGVVAAEGTVVAGTVTAASRARAFNRGGRIVVQLDRLSADVRRSEAPIRFVWPPLAAFALVGARDPTSPDASTFFGRSGAGWSGFLMIGALVAQISEPVALGFGAWGLAHSTWINVLRKGRDVVLPADSIVLLSTAVS